MYHKIRITVASLVIMTTCMLSSVSTLSYFTDSDTKTNSFTIGNISTTLAVYDDVASEPWREFDESNYETDGHLLPDTDYSIPFYMQATNDGNVTVYQRFRVVIPSTLADFVELALPEDMGTCDARIETCSNEHYSITYDDDVVVEKEGEEPITYAEYYIVSIDKLAQGGVTNSNGWPIVGIKINIPAEGDYGTLFTCADDSRNNCALGINVYSDAIQTTGFVDAEDAFTD